MPNILVKTGNYNIKLYVSYSVSQDTANNRSTITCGMYVNVPSGYTIGPWGDYYGSYVGTSSLTFNGSISNIGSGNHTLASNKTFTVNHNADGTGKATIYWKWGVNSSWGGYVHPSGSFEINLPTIPRASTLTASNGTLGTLQTLTVNRASTSFTHSIKYSCGSLTNQTAGLSASSGIGASCTFTPPISLAGQNTSGESVSVTFTITTYNNGTSIGSKTKTISCTIPASVKPSCDFTYSDTTSCYSTYGKFVQNNSALRISVSTTLAYSSPIKSYSITVDGKTYNSQNTTTDILISSGNNKEISVKVTDARNRTSNATKKYIDILPYSSPVVTLTAQRCTDAGVIDPEGSYMILSISGSISPLDNQNSATYEIKYKKSSDQSYTTLSGSGTSYTSSVITCDVDSIWNVEGTITDELSNTMHVVNIPIAFVLMDFYSSGKGIAFGKVAEQDGFDCDMVSLFKKNSYFTGDVTFLGDVDFSGLIDDYVVSQGTTNGWTYRKWNSGVLEQWGRFSTTIGSWDQWGGIYYSGNSVQKTFAIPFLSGTTPTCTSKSDYQGYASWDMTHSKPTNTQTSAYHICRATNNTSTDTSFTINIYAVGKWK